MSANWTHTFFPALTKTITRWFYDLVTYFDTDVHLVLMNYGYIELDESAPPIPLSAQDEKLRLQIQLYHHIARAADWTGRDSLEVGSGRGGGASYVMRTFHPRALTGLDLSARAVRFCRRHFADIPGLAFIHGDAENLHFPDSSFDIVLNVESSLYYPNVDGFLCSVFRVLKPGGTFLYADLRYVEQVESWRKQIRAAGFELVREEDITPNTRTALALDQAKRLELIDRYVPKIFHAPFHKFAGTKPKLAEGSPKPGERVYLNFVLKKP